MLAKAKKVSVDSAIGLMLLFEVARPAQDADPSKIKARLELARKTISAQLFNISAQSTYQNLLEEFVQTRTERGRYVMPSEFTHIYTRLHPPQAYEPEQVSYYRLRNDMMRGLEELFRSPDNV